MSIESALEKLADAITAHAQALTSLASTPQASSTGTATAAKADSSKGAGQGEIKDVPDRTIYWKHENGQFGKCSNADYKKMLKADGEEGYSMTDPDEFKALSEAAKKREQDNKKAAEKAAKVKSDAAAKAKGDEITDEDLGALVKPFAGVDDPKERKRRVEWLKAVFSRFGVPKASALDQKQRPEFCELIQKAVEATEDDEGAELPDVESGDNDLV